MKIFEAVHNVVVSLHNIGHLSGFIKRKKMMKTLSFRFCIELQKQKVKRTKTSINITCKYLRKNALCPGEEGERFDGEEGVRLWCLDLEEIAPPRLTAYIQDVSKKLQTEF